MLTARRGRIGVALGSGSARGWAHIGVLRALDDAGLRPDIVAGASIGAIVGAAYAAGELDSFEAWVRDLDWRKMASLFDFSTRGGLLKARKVLDVMPADLAKVRIESLGKTFAAVATDLATGREVWLREGPLAETLRASIALPGLIAPVQVDGRWLADGGLVNPVPVSICRALGADTVIAVDLNTTLVGRRFTEKPAPPKAIERMLPEEEDAEQERATMFAAWQAGIRDFGAELYERIFGKPTSDRRQPPSMYEVMANAINIMQVRITRSRMAGDPPDLLVAPRLVEFGLFDFDRAHVAIEEGRRATAHALAAMTPP